MEGSVRSYNGKCNENATSKWLFAEIQVFFDYLACEEALSRTRELARKPSFIPRWSRCTKWAKNPFTWLIHLAVTGHTNNLRAKLIGWAITIWLIEWGQIIALNLQHTLKWFPSRLLKRDNVKLSRSRFRRNRESLTLSLFFFSRRRRQILTIFAL